jgi:hypothetical protein
MLDEQEASPVVLAKKLGQPLGTVSYHVRTLHDLGLLDLVRTRQRRGATEHVYRTRERPALRGEAWDELGVVPKQSMVGAGLAQIHDYASRSAAAGGFDTAEARLSRTSLELDARGLTELSQATTRWMEQTARIEAAAAKRLQKAPESKTDVGLALLLFEALPFSAGPTKRGPAKAK